MLNIRKSMLWNVTNCCLIKFKCSFSGRPNNRKIVIWPCAHLLDSGGDWAKIPMLSSWKRANQQVNAEGFNRLTIILITTCRIWTYFSSPMMKALSLMQWVFNWGHSLILQTSLWRTLVDGPVVSGTIKRPPVLPDTLIPKYSRNYICIIIATEIYQSWQRLPPHSRGGCAVALWWHQACDPWDHPLEYSGSQDKNVPGREQRLWDCESCYPAAPVARGEVETMQYNYCWLSTLPLLHIFQTLCEVVPFLQGLCCCRNEP